MVLMKAVYVNAYTYDFWLRCLHFYTRTIFVALSNAMQCNLQCNVCCKCKLAVISMRFGCDICCDFPKIAAALQSLRHRATNRTEMDASLRMRFEDATKIAPKVRQKLHKNRLVKPITWATDAQVAQIH